MKKTQNIPVSPAGTTISHCNFTNEAVQVNEYTRDAVVALAKAAEANANALAVMAEVLSGNGNTNGPAVHIGDFAK